MSQKSTKKKYEPSDLVAAGKAIIYYKNYREMCGSVNSAILFNQLEFWFSATKGKSFYKYLSPLKEEINGYKRGDSWTEELGFSESEFRNAFKKIGTPHKSKKDYDEFDIEGDIFGNKMYCSYHNKRSGQTFYIRNHELIKANLENLREKVKNNPYELKINTSVDKESQSTEIDTYYPKYTDNTSEKTPERICLCYSKKTGKPVFLWLIRNDYFELLNNEGKIPVRVYINELAKNGKYKREGTTEITITRLKLEALIDKIIEEFFSKINDSYNTLSENKQQRAAIRNMLENRKIGYHGIMIRTQEIARLQDTEELGYEGIDEYITATITPIRLFNNHKRVRLYYKNLFNSDYYWDWYYQTFPEELEKSKEKHKKEEEEKNKSP